MLALITGASSGIGREIALELSRRGYDVIISGRNEKALQKLSGIIKTKTEIICADLSDESECIRLHDAVKDKDIDVFVNNAGFGVFGDFCKTPLADELAMINVNVRAFHILTKLFLQDFDKKNKGYILNVASSAGLTPAGPLMAGYYASKSYAASLSQSVYGELRAKSSNVSISVLCPGPVATDFSRRAGVNFAAKPLSAKYVAKTAVDGLFAHKLRIVPGFVMKCGVFAARFVDAKTFAKIAYGFQKNKS